MSPLLADQTWFLGLLCALPFIAIAIVPASIWLIRRIARQRRAGLPIFDHRTIAARLAHMPSPKRPNRREALMIAAVGAALLATLLCAGVLPWGVE
jgi:hypothetical protein